jgi:DNA-binding NarL/FixJ family response regulator
MSRTVTRPSRPSVADGALDTEPDIALIADEDAREEIAEIAERERLRLNTFIDLDALLSSESEPALVLVWVKDTSSSAPLAGFIEPLAQRFAQAPIVLACAEIERWEVRAALVAGAAGIVLHEDLESALAPCLGAVLAGQTCVPREHWRQIEPPALSAREKQILGLVVMGYMNGQIAEQLFLAESTVKSHLSSAFGKLGVRSRNEAVNLILDPERGLGMGILALGGEPLEATTVAVQ